MFKCLYRQAISVAAAEETSRKFWNTMAKFYNKYNIELSNKNYEALAPFLNLKPGQSILDAGCGAGNGYPILSNYADNQLNYSLIDISDEFVNLAQELYGNKADVRKVNAESLPYKSGTFDVYVANGLLEITDNPEWVVSEAFRVLKQGGKAGFSLYGRMGICNVLRIYRIISNTLRIEKGTFEPRFELSEPEKVKALLKSVGFEHFISFYEQYHYPQLSVKELFHNFWDNPVLYEEVKNSAQDKKLEKIIMDELSNILEVKEEPLIFESLIIIATKP
jgi:ubiquinone/menaquinone biosynthesis C-methylase UbiE